MKWRIAAAGLLLVLLTACGGGDPEQEPDKGVGAPKCGAPGVCV
jgi:hypothetical protein